MLKSVLLLTATLGAMIAEPAAAQPAVGDAPAAEEAVTAPVEEQFWRVQFFLRLKTAPFPRRAESFIPASSPSQEILSLRHYSPDYTYRERRTGSNVRGEWSAREGLNGTNWIIYDLSARTVPQEKPKKLLASATPPPDADPLEPDETTAKLLDEKIRELGIEAKSLSRKVRVIYDYTANSIEKSEKNAPPGIPAILEANRADDVGRTLLFRGLLSRIGVATREANGFLLKDRQVKEKFHRWAQAWLNDRWLNFDFTHNQYAALTADHLAVYYGGGESPLKITPGADYQYRVVIGKLSGENALDPGDLVIPQKDLIADEDFRPAQQQESEVTHALGRIAVVTETPIPESIVGKISERAGLSRTKVYFFSTPYESHFFRGTYIAKLLSQNVETLRETDAILIQSADDAGLYALFKLARDNKRLKKSTIILNGGISGPVAKILGYALFKLLKPKDLFIIAEPMGIERAWSLVEDHVLDGLPMDEVGRRWNIPFLDLSASKTAELSPWRRFLVKTWTLATKAEVNLESIYLTLMLPVIALVIVLFRNVIGMDTFGTFSPVIISVSFLTTGLFWGVIIFFTIVATGLLFRLIFRTIHIHLVARMAMLIAVVGITMLGVIIIGVHWGLGALVNISILPMVIMSRIVEDFTRTQMEAGTRQALRMTVNTLLVAAISYILIDMVGAQSLVLVFPEVILGAIAVEMLVGRWNGVRLLEYFRFYRIVGPQATGQEGGAG